MGFAFIDIQTRPGDLVALQRGDQRRLIHHIPARDVDQVGRGAHLGQCTRVDQVVGGGAGGHGKHDEISLQNLRQRGLGGGHVGDKGGTVVENDRHAKAVMAAPGNRLPDPPHADDAHRLARDMGTQQLGRMPARPVARPQHPLALARAARRHQDQRQGDIGGRIGDSAGGVADLKASGAGGGHVDMVIANAKIGEDFGARVRHIGKDIGAEQVTQRRQNGVVIAQGRPQRLG